MRARSAAAVVVYVVGVITAGGTAVIIIMGHGRWHTWLTLANSIGMMYVIWAVRRAERAGQARAQPDGPASPRRP